MPDKNKSLGALVLDGLWGQNPALRLALGLCPAVAVTTTGYNGLVIGLATAAVLVCSELVISLVRGLVTDWLRLPTFMAIIAAFAAGAQTVLKLYYPEYNQALGIFVPLIAANTLLIMRAETFAGEVGPVAAVADGIGMGVGYACALALLGMIRELFAYGTAFCQVVFSANFEPNAMALLPAGGFMLLGLLMGLFNAVAGKPSKGKEDEAA